MSKVHKVGIIAASLSFLSVPPRFTRKYISARGAYHNFPKVPYLYAQDPARREERVQSTNDHPRLFAHKLPR